MKPSSKTAIKQPLLFSMYLYKKKKKSKYSKGRLGKVTFSTYVVTLH